jgi:cysteinyl-tRNA synthetase
MKIFNSYSNQLEVFEPIHPGKVSMYVCGPTVYNYIHIGNARPVVVFDVVRRYFESLGYEVTFVSNFTDVDDKIIQKAIEEHVSEVVISEKYIQAFLDDVASLNSKTDYIKPKVTEYMPKIMAYIQNLIDIGYAYEVDGDVYFRVSKLSEYGKLSNRKLEDLISGARVEINDKKESPLDFTLWKRTDKGIQWLASFSEGRPGWHTECVAMIDDIFHEQIDIHGGGTDLMFPHHENEIAQCQAKDHHSVARYWMHNGYINVDNVKMSKSLGNFFTVRDISEKFDLEAVRLFIVSAHYKSPINFSDESLVQARSALERLYNVKHNLAYAVENAKTDNMTAQEQTWAQGLEKFKDGFIAAMDDDLNTANALSELFEMAKHINVALAEGLSKQAAQAALDAYMALADVLGLLYKKDEILDSDVEKLIEARAQARRDKNFARADAIRGELLEKGIVLEDTREGVKWRRA